MTSSFPATSSAPPGTTATRVVSNSQFTRILTSNANQASAQRGKAAFESRRSSNVATPYKRAPPAPITSNPRNASILSRIEIVPLPATHIGLQQQMSSPGRLQRQPPLSPSSSQYVLPATALLDPPLMGRNRAVPLRPANIRNAIHRNAISLNALAMNNQNGPTARGRSQNSASKGASSTRIARIRQQSLATSDLQPPNLPYSSATVIYRHPMNPDPPPVFFEWISIVYFCLCIVIRIIFLYDKWVFYEIDFRSIELSIWSTGTGVPIDCQVLKSTRIIYRIP